MRRSCSLACLLAAWLCANGALWNVVQLAGWANMIRDNARSMPMTQALAATFDGSKPCSLCHLSQSAQDTAREQSPRDTAPGGSGEKILLVAESVPPVVLAAPDFAWPGVLNDAGLARTEAVPVPPPRV